MLRKDYLAQNVCVNRYQPQLKCLGKCFLKKQMAQAAKQSKETQRQLPIVAPLATHVGAVQTVVTVFDVVLDFRQVPQPALLVGHGAILLQPPQLA